MEVHGSSSADLAKKLAEAGFSEEQLEREYFTDLIEEMEEEREYGIITKEMPRPTIVKYHGINNLFDKHELSLRMMPATIARI